MKSPDEMAEFYMRLRFTIIEVLHSAPKKKKKLNGVMSPDPIIMLF
jgi:hypothetical protein